MIMTIIDTFRQQAVQHKVIKSFAYNRKYEIGTGKEAHPMLWLEDPIYGKNANNIFTSSANFSILFIPTKDKSVKELQNLAFSTGLNIIERIKSSDYGITVVPDWTYVTLCNYYDNNACGCRFSINFIQPNMQNLCLIEEQFDVNKKFETKSQLADLILSPSGNCEIFSNKLPNFNLKIRK